MLRVFLTDRLLVLTGILLLLGLIDDTEEANDIADGGLAVDGDEEYDNDNEVTDLVFKLLPESVSVCRVSTEVSVIRESMFSVVARSGVLGLVTVSVTSLTPSS